MNGPEIHEMVIDVPIDILLSSIWYSDGSGAGGAGVPVSGPSSDFTIDYTTLYPEEGFIRLHLKPKDES